jgi:hypothetical protein
MIAGAASGVGKTTVTLGLLEVFRRLGLAVQGFKIGPDFIDPRFHELVTGRGSYNLDGWMCGRDHVLATVARHAADVDLANFSRNFFWWQRCVMCQMWPGRKWRLARGISSLRAPILMQKKRL